MKERDPVKAHKKICGKIGIYSRVRIGRKSELSLWYTPGVGKIASYLARHPRKAREYTIKRNAVCIISDGSATLGLGNTGPYGALPVMEGKAAIFKEFADVDAFPIVLDTQDAKEIVQTVKSIAPAFGGINLEDISAPRCFEIEKRLKSELDIPVFHDDQHGTAIVVLAGLLNALKIAKKNPEDASVTIVGSGAAGTAVTKLLNQAGIGKICVVDSHGMVSSDRKNLNPFKQELAKITGIRKSGSLEDAVRDADVVIGVSRGNALNTKHIRSMARDPIVFALSNPIPEIHPEKARKAGACIVATGRSDFPNQINNALVFPGVFRGALDSGVSEITDAMKLRAAYNLAGLIKKPGIGNIISSPLDPGVVKAVAKAIR